MSIRPFPIKLPMLANEVLDDMISYLPPTDQHVLMCSCRGLHWVAARQLYMYVDVRDHRARRLFKTLTESKLGYEHFVRTLKYTASSNTDVHLTHILLRDAICRLESLQHLSLSIRSTLSPFLIYILKRSLGAPGQSSTSGDYGQHLPIANTARAFDRLPKLRTFSLHGDIRLIRLLSYHRINKLQITEPLTDEEFDFFLATVVPQDTNINSTMTDLTLTFERTSNTKIAKWIYKVAQCFPGLRRLSLQGPVLNALDASQILSIKPAILPVLEELNVNQTSVLNPQFYAVEEGDPIELQRKHVIEAGSLRPSLARITFATILWHRETRSNTWKITQQADYELNQDLNIIPEIYADPSLSWGVDYQQPVPITSFSPFHL